MRRSVHFGKDLRLVNRGVGTALAMSFEVGLSFPVLIEQEDTAVVLRVINFEAGTAQFFAGEPPLLDEQIADLVNVCFALGSEDHVDVDHGELLNLRDSPKMADERNKSQRIGPASPGLRHTRTLAP